MVRPVRLDLDREHLTVAPGEAGRLSLVLRNTSDLVHHLQLEVRGLPAGARAVSEPPTVKLLPGATAQCSLTVELAATPPADAGEHVLGVLARSPHAREVSRCEEVRLEVPALPGLALAVEPELVRAGGRGRFTARLVNEGNTVLTVELAGSDPERRVRFSAAPPSVVLAPRSTAQSVVTAAVPRPWTGQETRRPLTLTAQAGPVQAASTVTLVQPPRLPPVLLRSLAGVVALLLLAGTLVLVDRLTGDGGADTAPAGSSEDAGAAEPDDATGPSADPSSGPSPTATAPTTAPPSGGPSPTAPPSPSPTGSAPPSEQPTGAPTPATVGLTDGASGPAVRLVEEPLPRRGFDVVVAPGAAASPDGCADVARLALHEDGDGDYVTAVDPADPDRCQESALTVAFLDDVLPVTDVVLQVAADGGYLVTATDVDGGARQVRGRARDGRLALPATEVGERLRSLTLAADPEDAPPARIGLVQVAYRAGGAS